MDSKNLCINSFIPFLPAFAVSIPAVPIAFKPADSATPLVTEEDIALGTVQDATSSWNNNQNNGNPERLYSLIPSLFSVSRASCLICFLA